jgi:hypothetical protein
MAIGVEVVLVSGERRLVSLPAHTGSVANALARLDDWIPTEDGSWVQKSHIVEVRAVDREQDLPRGGTAELEPPSEAAETLTDQGRG